jgi:LPXTG-site transpeptidase (sortase) family protein
MKLLAYLLIGFGLISSLLGFYQVWLKNDPNRLSFTNYTYNQSIVTDSKELPVRVTINSINITLPLIPAKVQNNTFDMTEQGASYLVSSPIPGNTGNSIIYAHNWASLFGNLSRVKKGDVVEIEFADKSMKKFVIESTATVSPNDVNVLKPTNDKKVTLYTCSGFLDSQRFVVVAVLQNPIAKK